MRRAQSTLDKGEKRLGEWLAFFLRCLSQQMHVLERKVEREQLMAALSALDESLLRLTKEHGWLTVASAVKLTDANRNTVKLHLRQLTEAGRLRLLGAGRGAWKDYGDSALLVRRRATRRGATWPTPPPESVQA